MDGAEADGPHIQPARATGKDEVARGRLKKLAARYSGFFRLATELGKHLNEVMGWEGPVTWPQYLAWRAWLKAGDPQDALPQEELSDWDERVAENQRQKMMIEAEREGGTVVTLKKSDERTATDLLHAGVTRKDKGK